METPIRNISDLKNEIFRLKELETEQGAAIRRRFNSPGAAFATVYSIFSGSADDDGSKKGVFHMDYIGLLSRILVPLTLNKTLFRNSGFIVKALVGLVSQKASGYISEENVTSLWDKAKSLVSRFTSKSHEETPEHAGSPAFGETY
jgi:hypothetical protein